MTIKPEKESIAGTDKPDRTLLRLLSLLKEYRDTTHDEKIRNTCDVLIAHLTNKMEHIDQSNHANRWDVLALQTTLSSKLRGNMVDPALLLKTMMEELHMRAQICPPF